jgi:hypothetical protein
MIARHCVALSVNAGSCPQRDARHADQLDLAIAVEAVEVGMRLV